MRKIFIFLTIIAVHLGGISQENPVLWKIDYNKDNSSLKYKASIEFGWHLYAAHLPSPDEGPLPTEFKYIDSDYYQLTGQLIESKPIKTFDDNFGIDVSYFENSAEFSQKIKVTSSDQFSVSGKIYYMVCNEQMCIPFEDDFSIKITP
jgi:thiol:disulfide interchange protein DsbD